MRPYHYIVNEVPLSYTILAVFLVFIVYGIVIGIIALIKWIKAICHPITFPNKHVLITGGGAGLGKALVHEVFMKGAYITIIGRTAEKLRSVAESIDVRISLDNSNNFFR